MPPAQVPRHRIYCALLCRLSGLPWDLIVTDMCFMEKKFRPLHKEEGEERAQEEEGKGKEGRRADQKAKAVKKEKKGSVPSLSF